MKSSRTSAQDFSLIRVEVLNCSLGLNKYKYMKIY